MKREASIFFIVILFIFGLLLFQFYPMIDMGPVKTRVMELPDFQQLDVDIPYNVFLVEGEMNTLVVEGPENTVSSIFYEFNDTVLNINHKPSRWVQGWLNWILRNRKEINVYITAKDLSLINVMNPEIYSIQRSCEDSPVSREIITCFKRSGNPYIELYNI